MDSSVTDALLGFTVIVLVFQIVSMKSWIKVTSIGFVLNARLYEQINSSGEQWKEKT